MNTELSQEKHSHNETVKLLRRMEKQENEAKCKKEEEAQTEVFLGEKLRQLTEKVKALKDKVEANVSIKTLLI